MAQQAQDRLIVMLEARVTEFEKRMNRADQTMRRNMRNVESHADRMRKRVDASLARVGTGAFRNLVLGATAALAPILSVGAALRTANAALQDFDKLANRASMFGVDVEWLQEMRYAAEQGGMGIENFDTALRRFVRRAAEAAQGTGAAKNAFKELGISLHDNEGRLKASEELLAEVADAMQRVPEQADKLRLAFQMFDTDGAAMVNVLKDGSDGLDEFAAKARELGIVIDRDLIARSQELKGELDTATRVMDSQFKQALVNLAPFLVQTAQLAAQLAGKIRDIGDGINYMAGSLEAVSSDNLAERIRTIGVEEVRLQHLIHELQKQGTHEANQARIDALVHERQRMLDEAANIEQILAARRDRSGSNRPDFTDLDDLDLGLNRNAAADAAIKQAEAVKRLIENLKHEQDQLGRTAEEQELYNALKSVGVELESEYGQAIAAAVTELQLQREAVRANADAMKLLEQAADSALDAIIDGLLEGKDAGEAFHKILLGLAKDFIKLGIGSLGSGFQAGGFNPLGFLGSLFGFASGTPNTGGRRGEPRGIVHGQEAVIPLPNGGRVPVDIRVPSLGSIAPAQAQELRVHVVSDDEKFSAYVTDRAGRVVAQSAPAIIGASVGQANKTAPAAVAGYQRQRGGADWRNM